MKDMIAFEWGRIQEDADARDYLSVGVGLVHLAVAVPLVGAGSGAKWAIRIACATIGRIYCGLRAAIGGK